MTVETMYWVPAEASGEYRLHIREDCPHFGRNEANPPKTPPPRPATPDEVRNLKPCGTCGRTAGAMAKRPAAASTRTRPAVEHFTCPMCMLQKAATSRQDTGMCSDCAVDY
jgi:hypothetical protein